MRYRTKVRLSYSISFLVIGLILGNLLTVYYAPFTGRAVKEIYEKPMAGEVKIGALLPLTGDAASYGENAKKGIEVAVKEINDKNLLGSKLEVVFENSKCDEREALTAMEKLINVDKVNVVIGDMCSSATLAVSPIAEKNRVVLISPASTSQKITEAGDFIFRTVPSDALEGIAGAKLVDDLDYKRLAIMYLNNDYGTSFKRALSEGLKNLGREVVAEESFEQNSRDMNAQLKRIKSKNPDSLYIISNMPKPAGIILMQIQELGLPVQVFGSEGLKDQSVLDASLGAGEGLILTFPAKNGGESFQRFEMLYKEMFNAPPGIFSAESYDAVQVIAEAIKDSDKSSESIRDRLYELVYDGASGLIDFDENGDISRQYTLLIARNNEFIDLSSISKAEIN